MNPIPDEIMDSWLRLMPELKQVGVEMELRDNDMLAVYAALAKSHVNLGVGECVPVFLVSDVEGEGRCPCLALYALKERKTYGDKVEFSNVGKCLTTIAFRRRETVAMLRDWADRIDAAFDALKQETKNGSKE